MLATEKLVVAASRFDRGVEQADFTGIREVYRRYQRGRQRDEVCQRSTAIEMSILSILSKGPTHRS